MVPFIISIPHGTLLFFRRHRNSSSHQFGMVSIPHGTLLFFRHARAQVSTATASVSIPHGTLLFFRRGSARIVGRGTKVSIPHGTLLFFRHVLAARDVVPPTCFNPTRDPSLLQTLEARRLYEETLAFQSHTGPFSSSDPALRAAREVDGMKFQSHTGPFSSSDSHRRARPMDASRFQSHTGPFSSSDVPVLSVDGKPLMRFNPTRDPSLLQTAPPLQ